MSQHPSLFQTMERHRRKILPKKKTKALSFAPAPCCECNTIDIYQTKALTSERLFFHDTRPPCLCIRTQSVLMSPLPLRLSHLSIPRISTIPIHHIDRKKLYIPKQDPKRTVFHHGLRPIPRVQQRGPQPLPALPTTTPPLHHPSRLGREKQQPRPTPSTTDAPTPAAPGRSPSRLHTTKARCGRARTQSAGAEAVRSQRRGKGEVKDAL